MELSNNPRSAFRAACGALALLATAGCGEATGDVRGVVTLDGQPLPRARVTFLSEGDNKAFFAISGDDGSYAITKCPVGPAVITVETYRVRHGKRALSARAQERMRLEKPGFTPKAEADAKYVPIPNHYGDPARSGLSYAVQRGPQEHNLELTTK